MTGMKTPISPGVSGYGSRTVTIGVTGVCRQSVSKTSNYQVRVPYSQMSQALQSINRQGGKVASIQLMGNPPVTAGHPEAHSEAAAPKAAVEENKASKKASKRKRR